MKVRWLFSLIVATAVLAACGGPATNPPATTAPAPPGAQVQPATPVPAGPKRGGKVVVAYWQSPVQLNFYASTQTVVNDVNQYVVEGLTNVSPDGTRVPWLAKEVPTLQNGGVSADGKTVTYKLKEGVLFSDGSPLACDDVKFTWQYIMTPNTGVTSTAGYREIDSLECPDALTIVIKFKNVYAPFLTLFERSVIPRNAGKLEDAKNWPYNRKLIGTGPWKIDEWAPDSHITLSRNEKYREQGKPYLDQLILRYTPSSDVTMQLLQSGEVDVMWNNTEADIPQLEKMAGVKIVLNESTNSERFFLNMAENKDGADPTKPHPILSDKRVRQAISLGIDRQRIIDKLLFGKAKPGSSELVTGFFSCPEIPAAKTDVAKAKQLLDEAGYKPGADGIRVKDGNRMRFMFQTTSGNKLREDSQVLMAEDMKAIGIELSIQNAPSAVTIGTWDSNAPRARGNFDIVMYTTGAGVDAHAQMFALYHSTQIPSEKFKSGTNITRYNNLKIDGLLDQAAKELDPNKRKGLYCEISKLADEDQNMVYVYARNGINSHRTRVQGNVAGNNWRNIGWDSVNWWIDESKK